MLLTNGCEPPAYLLRLNNTTITPTAYCGCRGKQMLLNACNQFRSKLNINNHQTLKQLSIEHGKQQIWLLHCENGLQRALIYINLTQGGIFTS